MSIKINHHLVDDLALAKDPKAEVPADGTVQFALQGQAFEIDLTAANEHKLRKSLEPYMRAGRRLRGPRHRSRPTSSRQRSGEIRAWAKQRGIVVNERGRIPGSVIEQYERATGHQAA